MEVYKSLLDLRDNQIRFVNEENIVNGMYNILDDQFIGVSVNNTFMDSFVSDMDLYVNTRI